MKSVFADTFYFLALLNERATAHKRAVAASRTAGLTLVSHSAFIISHRLVSQSKFHCLPSHVPVPYWEY